jgi:hypothetical protein
MRAVIEPERHVLQRPQAPNHQPGTYEEQNGHRHFSGDQSLAHALARGSGRALAALFQRSHGIETHQPRNRRDAEEGRRAGRHEQGEQEDGTIHACRRNARNAARCCRREYSHRRDGEHDAADRA